MFKRGRRAVTKATANNTGSAKEEDAVTQAFDKYKEPDEDTIGPEGVERLCRDLGLEPTDRKVLILAWKMNAQRMGFFSRDEFERGWRTLKCASLDKLPRCLTSAERELASPDLMQGFYEFAFKFCLTEPRQKIVEMDTAVQMLGIVLAGTPHLARFTGFLQSQAEYKTMNLDQWMSFWRFTQEVGADFSGFDENEAWPLLIDNYVEWCRDGGP